MLIAEDTVYDVEFVAWPENGTGSDAQKNAHFVYIYIDGIISGGYRIASGSSIFQNTPSNISLGVSTATLDLYRVWGYRRALNDNESLDCYILDQDDNIDLLFEKRDNNNILNTQGGVTPNSLPDGTRIMIITGKATPTGGTEMASVLAAAIQNNKSKYFPCTEISTYIKGATDRSKNFIAHNNGSDIVEGQDMSLKLRLQGTSSLAYPVKNYRIYTKKSTMYVGNNPESVFGETGELVSGGKFSMHDTSAPVAVWCLKADYAESSSSHNTGMACMVNDTLKYTNIKTPAQRDVNTTQYPYEVRTTVDGEPCILFYRETLSDAPIFLGKFNFNNDKSTEAVYGFTGIKGYHNVAPLNNEDNNETEFVAQQYKTETGTSLGVDLTECWEFKNNEDLMGSFLDDDFVSTIVDPDSGDTIPKWTGTFEARYPDEDDLNDQFASGNIVPHYLSTLVSWVKSTGVLSTDTEEQAAKLTKFRNELSLYFDVEHLCSYFVFTQMMACLDQMVKNMMMAFWYDKNADSSSPMGKVRAYMIFYDNDTILGVINNGRLLAPYNVTRQTIQMYDAQQNPVYFYAGHESVLWNNLATQFPTEIRNAYVKLRGYLTNARIFQYFDVQQTDKFCERIYNLDALNKYVAPTGMSESAVSPYRDLMQGNRKSHRHFFVNKRMSIFDNEWRAGEYYSAANEISFKGISAAGSAIGFTLKQAGNVEVRSDVSDDFVKNYIVSGNTPTSIGKLTPSAVGTIFHVYGMRQLTSLNLAAWDFDQLNLGNFQYLEEFVFGAKRAKIAEHGWRNSGGYIDNNGTAWFSSGISMPNGYILKCKIYVRTSNDIRTITAASDYTSGEKLNSVRLTAGPSYAIMVDGGVANNRLQFAFNCEEICEIETSNITNNQYIKINGETKASATKSITNYASQNINIFRNNNDTYPQPINAKCYYLQLFNPDGSIVRDFWPAIDDNGVACMYDYVTKQYFYNQGTGEFTVSDEVRNAGVAFVEKDNPFTKPYYNSGLILGNSMPRLKRFVAQNLTALPTVDLSGCSMIEEIDLSGSKVMSSVNIPVGAPLTKYKLPTAGMISKWNQSGGRLLASASGISRINTNIQNKEGLTFKFKVRYSINTGNYPSMFAEQGGGAVFFDNLHQNFYYRVSSDLQVRAGGVVPTINSDHVCTAYYKNDQATVIVNDSTSNETGTVQVSNGDIEIIIDAYDIYYFQIYNDNDTLIRDMYPAIDDSGVACMYDYVTKQFFYNFDSSSLSVSQEVIDARIVIPNSISPYQLSLVGLPSLDEWDDEEETGLDYGVPSKIQSLTFRDCPLIDGFDLLTTIASAYNTALNTVNVTLPSAISGPIADLITIANLWNSNIGENSNLKVYGSYTVTDASLTTTQCEAIGYDPNGAATQMSTKIYGLMVTIDQSTIEEIILQSYDPNDEGYNPAACILLEQANLGSYVDPNDYTKGWYMTKSQAGAVTSLPTYNYTNPTTGNDAPWFSARHYNKATDVHCIVAGNNDSSTTFDLQKFLEFRYFINLNIENGFFKWSGLLSRTINDEAIRLPVNLIQIPAYCFQYNENLKFIEIPESVRQIHTEAFSFSYINGVYLGLRRIICRPTTPIVLHHAAFYWNGTNFSYPSDLEIFVPDDSVNAYKNAEGWSQYASVIKPISELNNE